MSRDPTDDTIAADDEAMDWALRMTEPGADWDAFVAWLEGDPARAERYDRAVFAVDQAAAVVAALPPARILPANDTMPYAPQEARPPWRRRVIVGGALAAGLALTVGLGLRGGGAEPYLVETHPGVQRTVSLEDGSRLVLAGGSRVRLDRATPRFAQLEAGQVLFQVRHDATRPFRVEAGGLRMTDLGTVFDVRVFADQTRVEVSEGAVMVDPAGAAVRLAPGQAAVAAHGTIRRIAVERSDVGAWRTGRLTYDGAPLRDVASDLSRHLGRRVVTSPLVANVPFNGTLDVTALRDDPALLGALLSVDVRRDGEGWTLEPRP